MITQRYLQITYRNGRPFAAYLYLPRKLGDKSARSVRCESGLVIDYAADGRPIGIEITAPQSTSIEAINRAIATAQLPPVNPIPPQRVGSPLASRQSSAGSGEGHSRQEIATANLPAG